MIRNGDMYIIVVEPSYFSYSEKGAERINVLFNEYFFHYWLRKDLWQINYG